MRTYSAGVFAGTVAEINKTGKVCLLTNARRLWFWSGAASLSQMAMEGTKNPSACKFAIPVSKILVTEAIEIIPATERAEKSIREVPDWKS